MLPSEYIKQNALAILSTNCLNLIDKLSEDMRLFYTYDIAYILATIRHETANTYLPIKEYGLGAGKEYGKPDSQTNQTYYGRGYIQLTWKENYAKFGQLLNLDLINNPDLALQPDNAYNIMIEGITKGLFTGKKLRDFINDEKIDYFNARRIINGTDKAELIAGYAEDFEKLLNKVIPNVS